jgi:hypothetical protein
MAKWRLYEPYFHGAGHYGLGFADRRAEFAVDNNGVFVGDETMPLHIIAARVGGKRDRPYRRPNKLSAFLARLSSRLSNHK